MWVFLVEFLHPLSHGVSVCVRIGVHTDAIDADGLYPPFGVLDEVAHQVRILLVQVRHRRDEPPFHRLAKVYFRGVGVDDGGQLVRRLEERGARGVARAFRLLQPFGQVQPVLRRRVQRPGVLETAVVEDHIHHHLQALGMGLVYQTAVVGISTETGVDAVVVRRGVAVIGGVALLVVRRVVLKDGRQPEGCHAKIAEIVQMLTDAVQIAAMPQRGLCAVFLIGAHTLHLRVMTGALGKTVGHQHVEHIGIGKALTLVAAHLAGLQGIGHLLLSPLSSLLFKKLQRHRARLGTTQVKIKQQVVRGVEAHDAVDSDTGIIGGHALHIADAVAIDHQLYRRVLHPHVPVSRFNSVNHCFLSCHSCQVECRKGG